MTEAEWRTTKLPLYMLREYPVAWDERKVRLFWCACLRRVWDQLDAEHSQRLVEWVENDPEDAGGRLRSELDEVRRQILAENAQPPFTYHPLYWALRSQLDAVPDSLIALVSGLAQNHALHASLGAGLTPQHDAWYQTFEAAERAEKAWQCDLIREVFGNPFRPVRVSPWLTSDVAALARGIYDDKAFDRMPILADALQDAGCANEDVLTHCREPREHVRGCWVVDLLLGKA